MCVSITKELDEEEEDEGGARFEVKAHQASHTNYLLMKGYFVPGIISLRSITSTEHIAVNACSLRIRLRNTHSHSLFTQSGEAHTHTHTVLRSLKKCYQSFSTCLSLSVCLSQTVQCFPLLLFPPSLPV